MLKIENLTKSFGNRKILDSLNLELEDGKIYALLGGNGAGKTTLFNVINRYLKPDSGIIQLRGKKLNQVNPFQINRLGIGRTFQDLRLITKLTVEENIRLAIPNNTTDNWFFALLRLNNQQYKKNIDERIENILEKFYLSEVRHNKASEISYGQQKLLTLACCVANNAQLLLLDEPISGIQPLYREQIALLLKELRDDGKGKTIFLIEHSPPFLEEVADKFLFLNNGKINHFNTYQELRTDKTVLESYLG